MTRTSTLQNDAPSVIASLTMMIYVRDGRATTHPLRFYFA